MSFEMTFVQIALVIWASYNIGKNAQKSRERKEKKNDRNKEA